MTRASGGLLVNSDSRKIIKCVFCPCGFAKLDTTKFFCFVLAVLTTADFLGLNAFSMQSVFFSLWHMDQDSFHSYAGKLSFHAKAKSENVLNILRWFPSLLVISLHFGRVCGISVISSFEHLVCVFLLVKVTKFEKFTSLLLRLTNKISRTNNVFQLASRESPTNPHGWGHSPKSYWYIGGVAGNTVGRYLAFDFLRENFDTLMK